MQKDTRSVKEHLANRSGVNKKPFRNAAQKAEAKRTAQLVDGRWVSTVPTVVKK